ncbi:LPS export ABC transporter periplasmic protein LptC [Kangiella sp.]|uniref:LPS export ABC transporter periplasmic protein LptC n=1 Tax=Kangiella sp. TaxID=1920245 RepID=UPI0019C67953|nr:LPS export ABC transporter periplasmic protein LptC [Kangiella sp.]MBD3653696.1 LPS export ABC transporter periplasmic protein LptC [Kangiella sp.]
MTFLKGRSMLWLLVPATFAIAYWWDRSTEPKPEFVEVSTNPDYYLANTETVEFDDNGQLQRSFTTEKTLHYKDIMQTHLLKPVMRFNDDQNPSWTVSSEKAISNELSEQLILEGNVKVELERQPTQSNAVLSMPVLKIDFASETAFTDEPIELIDGRFRMTAKGMQADLRTNNIEFLSEVFTEEL